MPIVNEHLTHATSGSLVASWSLRLSINFSNGLAVPLNSIGANKNFELKI